MRVDLKTVQAWLPHNAHILDLGCGDGTLLANLSTQKNIKGVGVEINPNKIQNCLEKNVQVIEMDIAYALDNMEDNSFDFVIMTQSLQVLRKPHLVLDQALRVGKEAIIAFPNFAHWSSRVYLSLKGKMPVSKNLPYTWYNTPNIHFFTVKDFEEYCHSHNIKILNSNFLNADHKPSFSCEHFPNAFCSTAIYHIQRS